MRIICKCCNACTDTLTGTNDRVYVFCDTCTAFLTYLNAAQSTFSDTVPGLTTSTANRESVSVYLTGTTYPPPRTTDPEFARILCGLGLQGVSAKYALHAHGGRAYVISILSISRHGEAVGNLGRLVGLKRSCYNVRYTIRRYNLTLMQLCSDAIEQQMGSGYRHRLQRLPCDLYTHISKKISDKVMAAQPT